MKFKPSVLDKIAACCGLLLESKVTLKEEINVEKMIKACELTIDTYKSLQMKVTKKHNRFMFVTNEDKRKPIFYNYENKLVVGSNDTFHYPYVILLSDKVVTFSFFHFVFDGLGMSEVCRTIVSYYKDLLNGIEPTLKSVDYDFANPLKIKYVPKDKSKIQSFERTPIKKEVKLYPVLKRRLIIDKDSLTKASKQLGHVPYVLENYVFALASKVFYDTDDYIYPLTFTSNLKSVFDYQTMRNSYVSTEAPIKMLEFRSKSIEEQLTIIKNTIKLCISKDENYHKVKVLRKIDRIFNILPGKFVNNILFSYIYKNNNPFFLNNVGNFSLDIIEDIDLILAGSANKFVPICAVERYEVNNKVIYSLFSALDDTKFMEEICKEFDKLEIKYHFEKSGAPQTSLDPSLNIDLSKYIKTKSKR